MIALTPRLETAFEKTKTICFGRFMVDVPASTTVAWGETDVPLAPVIYPGGINKVQTLAQDFIAKLKSERAINHNDAPLLLSVSDSTDPEGKIVVGYSDFEAINGLKINAYFKWNNDGVAFNTFSFIDEQNETISLIKSVARRLRHRADDEVPTEPGNCIEYAFLPDEPGTDNEERDELVRIGFRLKEFPDTHISIFIHPSDPDYTERDSLEWRLDRHMNRQGAEDPTNPLVNTKMLRRGSRQIHDWKNGFEALSRTPELPEMHSIHDFAMDFRGVPADPLKPSAEIQMQTGVAGNTAGAAKTSLTDEEAVAVWDKITSSIRVRPTATASAKTSDVGPDTHHPLGLLAATGRTCPRTGWWEPEASISKERGQRQHIKEGERMPHLVTAAEPSIWQKLKGERPSYRTPTMWKLVSLDAPPNGVDGTSAEKKA